MQLRLTVEAPGIQPTDLLIEAHDDADAGELLEALRDHLNAPAGAARVVRSGAVLARGAPLARADLRDGDRVELTPPDGGTVVDDGGDAVQELVVTGGPQAGRRISLAAGRVVVGRGPGADVVVDDPSLSRRHLVLEVAADAITVDDAGSSNGTFVGGRELRAPVTLRPGDVVEAGRSQFGVVAPRAPEMPGARVAGGRIAFNRPPRIARALPAAEHELMLPAEGEEPPSLRLGTLLIPLALGGVLALVTGNVLMLSFALLAPAMALYNFSERRRATGSRRARERAAFQAELEALEATVREQRSAELDARRAAAPDPMALRARVERLEPALWERRPADADFLELRVGTADRPSRVRASVQGRGDEQLRAQAEGRLGEAATLPAVPVTAPLAGAVFGIAGPSERVEALARWIVVQAATLHSPADLRIAAVVADAAGWDWVGWLPHAPRRAVHVGAEAGRAWLQSVVEAGRPALVVVDGALHLEPALVADVAAAGGAVVWCDAHVRQLPGTATWFCELDAKVARLRLVDVASGEEIGDVTADGLTIEAAEEMVRLLAAIDDAGAADRAELPRRVSLVDLLGIPDPDPEAVAARWAASTGHLRAPVGIGPDGPFEVDVGAVEGLRLLLGGMPGAGKSELLQAMIASLAVSHPPSRLTFLLVDYKGGAAFRDCVELPHTVGFITDLDAHLAERARLSLLAELRRREELLDRHGARSLRDLAARSPAEAPPTLLVVIDEFAALVRDVGSFVETLVDVAQRGRSLGLHLVLATQRPRGVVGDGLRANMNLRIAMRMGDRAESADILEAGDAAGIPADLPGRALAVTGRRSDGSPELTPFQAAYAGGQTMVTATGRVRVSRLRPGGAAPTRDAVLSAVGGAAASDLQRLVAAARGAFERAGAARPRRPWLPPLPERIAAEEVDLDVAPGEALVGVLDEPERQRRSAFTFDPQRDGSLLVYGASGAGKTTLLTTTAASLARSASPAELQIYGLDFASGALSALEALPHCGAVVRGSDDERVLRVLARFNTELAARKEGAAARPRLVLLVDGLAGFTSAFERVDYGEPVQTLIGLAAQGRPLGISVVAAANRRADVPSALAGVVGARVVLRLADPEEYSSLGIPRKAVASFEPGPGRGFTREGLELQVAMPGDLEALGRRLVARHDAAAPPVQALPTVVARERLPAPGSPLEAVLGLDDASLAPAGLSLADGGAVVAGGPKTGKTTALATIALSLASGAQPVALHLLAARPELSSLGVWTSAAIGTDEVTARVAELATEPGPAVILVDDAVRVGEGPAAASLDTLLRRGRDEPIRLVAAGEPRALNAQFGGWLRDLRGEGRGLLLVPNVDVDGDLLGVRLPKTARSRGPHPPGRGFLVSRGAAALVQVAS